MLKQSQNLHKVGASEQTTTRTREQDNCAPTHAHTHVHSFTRTHAAAAEALLWLATWQPFCRRPAFLWLCVCGWFASGAKDSMHVQYEKRADKLRTRSSAQRNGATSWGLSKSFRVRITVCKGCATPNPSNKHTRTHSYTHLRVIVVKCRRGRVFKCILANCCIYFNLKCPRSSEWFKWFELCQSQTKWEKDRDRDRDRAMLQHHHQHQPQSTGYFDYSQSPSPGSLTNADALNTTPFSVKDILNMVNQTEAYDGGYGHIDR